MTPDTPKHRLWAPDNAEYMDVSDTPKRVEAAIVGFEAILAQPFPQRNPDGDEQYPDAVRLIAQESLDRLRSEGLYAPLKPASPRQGEAEGELPQIALRRHQDGTLDDTVVTGVKMFRAEVLHDDCLWLCCYLDNGERITWTVRSHEYEVQEMPPEGTHIDFDEARREAHSVGEDDHLWPR